MELYNISVGKIYGVTTDNASYMLLCSDILDKLAETAAFVDDENESNITDVQEDYFRQILKEAVEDYFDLEFTDYVFGISCGVHTFQLAIGDTLQNTSDVLDLINKCRTIVKKLTTPTILRLLKEKQLHMPLLDNDTR